MQNSKLSELSNKMFFNIFTHQPHSDVLAFLQKYFPEFTRPLEPSGWTIYPSVPFPEIYPTVHSFCFSKHPYFNAGFREGRLDFLTEDSMDCVPSIRDFNLWLMFDAREDGAKAFEQLSDLFGNLTNLGNIREENGRKIAEFTDQSSDKSHDSVQFILTNDELHDNKCKLFFREGCFTYSD